MYNILKNPRSAPENIQVHTWMAIWNTKGREILKAKPLEDKYEPIFEFPEGRGAGVLNL